MSELARELELKLRNEKLTALGRWELINIVLAEREAQAVQREREKVAGLVERTTDWLASLDKYREELFASQDKTRIDEACAVLQTKQKAVRAVLATYNDNRKG
jgi:hypothetical protein